MDTQDLHPASLHLRKGTIHRLRNGLGHRIEALTGNLWITIDNDPRDIVVKTGEGFSVDRPGDILISALDDARFVVLEPVALQRH